LKREPVFTDWQPRQRSAAGLLWIQVPKPW